MIDSLVSFILFSIAVMIAVFLKAFGAGNPRHRVGGLDEPLRPAVPLIKEFSEIPRRAAYMPHSGIDNKNVHNGQLKLFLTELQFITLCLKSHDDEATIVYAGSAPSNKISYLADLFPKIKFVLVDPNEHYIMFPKGAPKDIFDDVNVIPDMYSAEYSSQVLFFQAGPRNSSGGDMSPGMRARQRSHKNGPPAVSIYKPRTTRRVSDPVSTPAVLEPVLSERLDGAIAGEIPNNLAEVIDKTSYRFYIIENLFTNELAEKLNKLSGKVYFISDIRTKREDESNPGDYDICLNSAMMYNWLARLKPVRFMLKFRCPWTITDESKRDFANKLDSFANSVFDICPIDFRGNYAAGKFEFIKPEHLFIQAFAGVTSTETRLVASKLDTMYFDQLEYEEKFMWFNTVHRQRNPIVGAPDNEGPHIKCYNNRQDCALAVKIFDDYLVKYNGGTYDPNFTPQTAINMLRELLEIIGRTLCKTLEHHEKQQKKRSLD